MKSIKSIYLSVIRRLYKESCAEAAAEFRQQNWQLMLDVISAQRSWLPKSWEVLFPTKIPTKDLEEMLDAAHKSGRDIVDLYDEDRRLWTKDAPDKEAVINRIFEK